MIHILDYGLGNIGAIANVYKRTSIDFLLVNDRAQLKGARAIILPGVGSFDTAINKFSNSGLRDGVENLVLNGEAVILGICVGMQMLAKSSEEGKVPGLGWIDGEVRRFDIASSSDLILPQMGWNRVSPNLNGQFLFENISNLEFYFLHSYYFSCSDSSVIAAKTNYFGEYSSAVRSKNIMGVQFHPEKSHAAGSQLLINFARHNKC
jgi:glutamine amidotransferase